MPWCTARSTREGADTAPLDADSLRGWCARNPAVVKGGGVVGLGAGPGMSRPGAKLRWARKARTRCRILDGGDDAQPAATAGPGEDSEIERTVHQRRPGPGVGGDGGVGLAREGGSVWGGAAVADDLGAPARARGEDAVVEKQVHRGTGDEGRQLLGGQDVRHVVVARWGRGVKDERPGRGWLKTPSSTSVWKWTFNWRPLPKRWITVTVPVWPSGMPSPRAVRA